ncbi:uncharacterized protein C19orf44 homolog isoform X1 [Dromiciops gliroides]|uniref:uncharacterized protein C19orf44 homolog isoform X1 n=1 Tax=Dromiciops gliroides TaxID=33562 RepID=UPI001CC40ACD|nr:uncharacterized protein C19orf44 homolog isoform X1 [Dromiciops gliroides]XP_043839923.1 uncharacterized protein C19orf44 homolog isoform X1 [Dromiciops gliroides]XP_043839929.1 uncharacterized protein C19orf44 homolog isoform X1 [Dromiciops gliroides]
MSAARRSSLLNTSHLANDFFYDSSDVSIGDMRMKEVQNRVLRGEGLANTPFSQSRFLKRKQNADENQFFFKGSTIREMGSRTSLSRSLTTASKMRANAALMKLAQIETKIMGRKLQVDLSDTDTDGKSPDDISLNQRADALSLKNVSDIPWQCGDKLPTTSSNERVSRFLKKKGPAAENIASTAQFGNIKSSQPPKQKEPVRKLVSLDSDEEEMKLLLGNFVKPFSDRETPKNAVLMNAKLKEAESKALSLDEILSPPSALSPPSEELSSLKLFRTLRLPEESCQEAASQGIPSRTPSPQSGGKNKTSRSPSLSIMHYFSRPTSPKKEHIKLAFSPEETEIGSLDELCSEASSGSLNDFKINILSLDDLAPDDISEKIELGQKEEDHRMKQPSKELKTDVSVVKCIQRRNAKEMSPETSMNITSLHTEEESHTASEICEDVNEESVPFSREESISSRRSPSPRPQESTINSVYSEDFEKSPSSTVSGQTAYSQESLDETLESLSESPSYSQSDLPTQLGKPGQKRNEDVRRLLVKEVAVQTYDPVFTYSWTKESMATIGPSLGRAYLDPEPIASHVISADAIEALTAYSPAAFALNDMLKQQLTLTKQFMETSRYLHFSLLKSLEDDTFHYQTLEEVKEYIKKHKSPPLTIEKALEEVVKEMSDH